MEPYITASVDVIGIAPGQIVAQDGLRAVNALAALDTAAEVYVMVGGQRYAIERVTMVHEPDLAWGDQAERNTIEVHIGERETGEPA